jgi:Large extracellular alpha-helical protein
MRLSKHLLAASLLLLSAVARADDAPRSFSLSTSRTFAPGESVKIQLFSRNVPELEFRVYRVNDVQRFFAGLKDLHSFGEQNYSPAEQIDRRTWIERIHDFKAHLWWIMRHFFRSQFTDDARDSFREQQGKLGKKSRVVGAAQFAQVPILNSSQLVARWKLQTPPALVSETQQLPIDGLGSGVYLIEATDGTYKAYTIAIVTNLAIVERTLHGQAELYIADRKTGAPIENAEVAMWTGANLRASGTTDSNGFAALAATWAGGAQGAEPENLWIIAKRGADSALITPWGFYFGQQTDRSSRAYIYTDRPVYRPGHTVHIKAVVRIKNGDSLDLPKDWTPTLEITDSNNKTIFSKGIKLSPHGTLTADIDLPTDAALGYYWLRLTDQGVEGSGSFYVEEYKKPEYQVTVKSTVAHLLQGSAVQATIEARYFFGEPVANAKVTYVVHTSPHYWWDEDGNGSDDGDADNPEGEGGEIDDTWDETEQQEHQGVLDSNGRLSVSVPTTIDGKHQDVDYRIEARVTDAANREVAGHTSVLATYGSFRVGVEPASYVYQSGQPVHVKVTAQDYENKPVQTRVHVAAALIKWDSVTRQRSESMIVAVDGATGADGTAQLDLPMNSAGSGDFEITASAETPESRTVSGHSWVWIWNGAGSWYQANAQAQIITDKKTYKVGDTAHLLLVTGLKEAWAVVTVEGETVQSRRLLHATGESYAFDVPITQESQPNVMVNVVIVHDNQLMTAQKSLKVPLVERTLTITATPNKSQYLPGEKGSFDVYAADSDGKPVQADLSFGEVDEALYKVRSDSSGDIVNYFYPKRYSYLDPQTSFDFYFSGQAGKKSPLLAELNQGLYHPRLSQVKPGSDLVVPKVRKAFPDTAYWNPNVRTGSDGHARVEFAFPDALTTWRTTIRGMTDDGKAGGVVTRVLVRKNLIVRLAAPRFFRQGDETLLRVIAHNYLTSAKDVTLQLDVNGADVIGGQTQKINIPARGESYAEWRVKTTLTGNAVFTAKALTNEESDALEMTLPILPYGVKQRQAGAGVVFSGAGQNQWTYNIPTGSDAGTRALTISVAPSVAGTVFTALDYLTSYPWGCTEQTMSSFLPDLIVSQAIDKLKLKSPIDRKQLDEMVQSGIERLYSFQHDDGGWGWWPDDQSRVFMTAYVVSGLGQARDAGKTIDDNKLNQGREWLQKTLAAHPDMLPDLHAYTVYALATTGGASKNALDKAWADRSHVSDEGLALIGLALDAAQDNRAHEVATLLEKKAHTSDVDAHWEGKYDGLLEYSDDTSSETTALALKLLIRQDRASGLLAKAAVYLASHRNGDYWYSTKQTAMVIQGLTDYVALSGELANASDVEVLVNGVSVGKRHFGPSDGFAQPWQIKVPALQVGSGGQVTVRKSGNGITYWSTESGWYTADQKQFQQGQLALNITRDYYVLQKRQDKPNDPITYDLKPLDRAVHVGDIIAVRLALNGTGWKYLLAEDPIPAGTEFLGETGLYKLNNQPDWWAQWFTRKEFHDDRAAFFNTEFSGRREYVYLLKVVNPGKFVISPAQAGPMYQSNVQTTTDADTLEVQP